MTRAVFDLSYRGAAPVEALVNPVRSDLATWLQTLSGDDRRLAGARWGLRSSGVLWFADDYTTIHQDDSHGRLVPHDFDSRLRDVLKRDAPLAYGWVRVNSADPHVWHVSARMAVEHDFLMQEADVQTMLGCFPAWRRAFSGAGYFFFTA